ncbi:MAG TPA: YchJ family metal-binding protein [Prolixibacteraceae bacterium]|nr:YchJ family metal-binding protein [Prolixibacteraceae bacterium]
MQNLCPCGSGQLITNCCKPIIYGEREAKTAQELMRSRYVAFTIANVEYLMFSNYSKTRPVKDRNNIEKWAKSVQWMGLIILQTQAGEINDETGYVEFKAHYLEDGKLQQIHENSLFRRENKRWVYVSGKHF